MNLVSFVMSIIPTNMIRNAVRLVVFYARVKQIKLLFVQPTRSVDHVSPPPLLFTGGPPFTALN